MSAESAGQGHDCPLADGDASPVFSYSYAAELDRALLALWNGTMVGAATAAERKEGAL